MTECHRFERSQLSGSLFEANQIYEVKHTDRSAMAILSAPKS